LRLAQDEPKEDDQRFEVDGYNFIVAQDIKQLAGDITIDASFLGVKVLSQLGPKDPQGCCSH
jgi:hypothetical protein